MRVLIVGSTGMLGSDAVAELVARHHDVVAPSRSELDLTQPDSVANVAAGEFGKLEWVINCGAYTAVDQAESEPDAALAINALGPALLSRACAMGGIRLVHVSTDFVFDGLKGSPYTEDDPVNPLGAYGRSKMEGEEAVSSSGADSLIVRTAWLYGPNGNSFPRTMIRAWTAGKALRVVSDQIGSPTYTGDLARVIVDLIEQPPAPGIYHAAGADVMSWHSFAIRAIQAYKEQFGIERGVEIEPIATVEWPTPARRPAYSALGSARLAGLGVAPMRSIDDALADFVARLGIVEG